ncbi:hypothetical protein Q1695_003366 [Nippostrongylus brasiliensis]|nr:hypothetical protein Q1695_003366 [Nippostrongylus brasiliensis]
MHHCVPRQLSWESYTEDLKIPGHDIACKLEDGHAKLDVVQWPLDAKCIDRNGNKRNQGDTWMDGEHFEVICRPRGIQEFHGCRAEGVRDLILPNTVLKVGIWAHHCIHKNGQVRYDRIAIKQ